MTKASQNNITIIRICQEDVYKDSYDWQSTLLPHLKIHLQPTRILLDNNKGIYTSIKYDMSILEELPLDLSDEEKEVR